MFDFMVNGNIEPNQDTYIFVNGILYDVNTLDDLTSLIDYERTKMKNLFTDIVLNTGKHYSALMSEINAL